MKLTIEIPDADEEQFRHCFRQWQQTGAVLYASICRGILDRCKQTYSDPMTYSEAIELDKQQSAHDHDL